MPTRKKQHGSRSTANAARNATKAAKAATKKRVRSTAPRPAHDAVDFFAVSMRRLGTDDVARNIYDRAPKLGADGLTHLHALACQSQYIVGRAFKQFSVALTKALGEGTLSAEDASRQLFAASAKYAAAMKKLLDCGITVNRLWLDNELDMLISELNVKTDNWRDAMTAYVDKVAAVAAATADPGAMH